MHVQTWGVEYRAASSDGYYFSASLLYTILDLLLFPSYEGEHAIGALLNRRSRRGKFQIRGVEPSLAGLYLLNEEAHSTPGLTRSLAVKTIQDWLFRVRSQHRVASDYQRAARHEAVYQI
jgi:hypothetical protein